ncbi:MAG: type II secretion system minor pseudopilin GspI [Gammaproteobacteria bacterium]
MDRTQFTIGTDLRKRALSTRGFTLIEVLVALAVIAIGLLAVLSVAASGTRISAELQQRNFASWIAQNEMARLRLAPQWPDLGEANDDVDFANQKWRWDAKTVKTQDPDLRRVTVTVSFAKTPDDSITQLVGFIGKPPAQTVALPIPGLGNAGSQSGQGTGNKP